MSHPSTLLQKALFTISDETKNSTNALIQGGRVFTQYKVQSGFQPSAASFCCLACRSSILPVQSGTIAPWTTSYLPSADLRIGNHLPSDCAEASRWRNKGSTNGSARKRFESSLSELDLKLNALKLPLGK